MKRTLTILCLLFALAALPALAQQNKLSATIPFDFALKGKIFTAGAYDVAPVNSAGTWAVSSGDRKQNIAFNVVMEDYPRDAQPKLVFHRYGNRYFLAQIWTPSLGMSVPESREELQIRASVGRPVLVALLIKH